MSKKRSSVRKSRAFEFFNNLEKNKNSPSPTRPPRRRKQNSTSSPRKKVHRIIVTVRDSVGKKSRVFYCKPSENLYGVEKLLKAENNVSGGYYVFDFGGIEVPNKNEKLGSQFFGENLTRLYFHGKFRSVGNTSFHESITVFNSKNESAKAEDVVIDTSRLESEKHISKLSIVENKVLEEVKSELRNILPPEMMKASEEIEGEIEEDSGPDGENMVTINLTTGETYVEDNYCELEVGFDIPVDDFNEKDFKDYMAKSIGVNPDVINLKSVRKGSCWVVLSCTSFAISKVIVYMEEMKEQAKKKTNKLIKLGKKLVKPLGGFFRERSNLKKSKKAYDGKKKNFVYRILKSVGQIGKKKSVDEFLKREDLLIRKRLQEHIARAKSSFLIKDITLVCNPKLCDAFFKRYDFSQNNIKLLYRACKDKYYESIFEHNFRDDLAAGVKLDPGWYGSGVYFTSYPLYALHYQKTYYKLSTVDNSCTVTASYVSLGKTYDGLKDNQEYLGKKLKAGYDSHFVKVDETGYAKNQTSKELIYDEYVVDTNKRILPRYVITLEKFDKSFVWVDPDVEKFTESQALLEVFRGRVSSSIFGAKGYDAAMELIKAKEECSSFSVIISSRLENKEISKLVRAMKANSKVKNIVVYCSPPTRLSVVKGQIDKDIKVVDSVGGLITFMSSSLDKKGGIQNKDEILRSAGIVNSKHVSFQDWVKSKYEQINRPLCYME